MKKIFLLFVGILLLCTTKGFSQATTMTLETVPAKAGDTVVVPINVANFTNIGAISLKISYDNSALTFVGTANSPVTFTSNAAGGVLSLSWFDITASTPVNISSGTLVNLKFISNGNASSLDFLTAQCEISNESGTDIALAYTNGGVTVGGTLSLSLSNVTAVSGASISVSLNSQHLNGVGAVSLKISYDPTVLTFTGIANVLNNLAFTANASGGVISISWFDQTGTTPINVDAASKLLDLKFNYNSGTSPLNFLTAQCDLSNSSGQSIPNITYVNGQVSPVAAPTLQLANVSASQGSATVPLTVQNLTNVGAISLKIQYDPTVLTFTGIANTPAGDNITANAAAGVLSISWFDQTGTNPINIASGKLLDIKFTYNGGSSLLTFNTSLSDIANESGTTIAGVNYVNGSVVVPVSPTLTLAKVVSTPNSVVSVPLTVKALQNVGAISLKITYDPAVLTFTGVSNTPAGVTFTANAAGGVISLGWFDATGKAPINLDSNAILLKLNFSDLGGSSALTFNQAQCDIALESGTSLNNVNYIDGSVGAAQPTVKISNVIGQTGALNVPVTVQSLKNIGAISLKISYNPAVVTFTGIVNAPAGVTFTANAAGGIISIGWFDQTGTSPISIDSAKLFDLGFTYAGGTSALTINTVQSDIATESGTSLNNVLYINGSVSQNPLTAPTLSLPNLKAALNQSVAVPLTGIKFKNIGAMSLKIQYNAAVLNFSGITNVLTGVTFTAAASNGIVNLGWFDPTGTTPINVDSAAILKLNFTYIGGTSALTFLSAQSEVSDESGNVISNVIYVNGNISQAAGLVFTKALKDTSISVHQALNFAFAATETTPGAVITFALAKGPGAITSAGAYSFTPYVKQTGVNTVIVSASDGTTTISDTAKVTVIDHAPVFTKELPDSLYVANGTPKTFVYAATSPDKDTLTFSLITGPAGSKITTNGIFSWVPSASQSGYYQIVVQVTDGVLSVLSERHIATEVKQEPGLPTAYALSQNYPNPFNPTTNIGYSIPKESFVQLKVFNILGQEIITLVNESQKTGNYTATFNALNIPSGIYIYRLSAGDFSFTRKMTVLK